MAAAVLAHHTDRSTPSRLGPRARCRTTSSGRTTVSTAPLQRRYVVSRLQRWCTAYKPGFIEHTCSVAGLACINVAAQLWFAACGELRKRLQLPKLSKKCNLITRS